MQKVRLKYLFWMQQQSLYPCSAVTSILQVPSCSCLASVKSLKSGHIRNRSMIWQEACLSIADKVWLVTDGQEVLVNATKFQPMDEVRVHVGNVIPFDGVVTAGEAMVNQTSLTGESVPVRKAEGSFAYAGTVLEEGELTVRSKKQQVPAVMKIVNMIEDSEKLKSSVESNAEHLADRLVPIHSCRYRCNLSAYQKYDENPCCTMVDFSCALKLAMPISVLSAIREASTHSITVKGGKYMEAMADATTIVFDKTGTLTKAKPVVADVVSFSDELSAR